MNLYTHVWSQFVYIYITNILRTSTCSVGHQQLLGHHLQHREKQVQMLQVVQAIHFCSRGLLDLQLWRCLLGAVHLRQLKVSKLSTHLAIWLHLTSSFWHCHHWKSHHRTRHKSKASPVQLLTSEFLDRLLKLWRSLSNSQISPNLSQPTLHYNLFQLAFCGWPVDHKKPAKKVPNAQTKSPNTPSGIKRIKLYTTVIV